MHIYWNRKAGRGRADSKDTTDCGARRFAGEGIIKTKTVFKKIHRTALF